MALVSLSRCSRDARSSGGAFGFAMSEVMLSFFGGCAGGAGDAGLFAGDFAVGGAVLLAVWPVEAAVDGVAVPLAGPTAAISDCIAATVGGGALGSGGRVTSGATTSVPDCGRLLWDGALGGGVLSPAQPNMTSTKASPTTPARCVTRSSA